ncbi:hypothetical protein E2C01_061180 [Portunus trituberculatus]|uniref:Uncharacterized protein n=1 Tax=Portunus trituberculatus TaxID=210409 RepID=A0A5B7H4J2_PORTR|nr:hypothetical protein [Portunus trituberculatus]
MFVFNYQSRYISIHSIMKVSTELLSQLVHKGDQGPREPFITYLSEFKDTPRGSVSGDDEAFHIFTPQSSSPCSNYCATPVAVFTATAVPTQPAQELVTAAVLPPDTDLPAGTQHHLPPDNPGVNAAPVHADDTVEEHPI